MITGQYKKLSLKDLPALKKFEIPSLHRKYAMRVGRKYKDIDDLYETGRKRSSHWDIRPDVNIREIDYEEDAEKIKLDHNYKAFLEDEEPFIREYKKDEGTIKLPENKKSRISSSEVKLNENRLKEEDVNKSEKKDIVLVHQKAINRHWSPLLVDYKYRSVAKTQSPLVTDRHAYVSNSGDKRNVVVVNFESLQPNNAAKKSFQGLAHDLRQPQAQSLKRNSVAINSQERTSVLMNYEGATSEQRTGAVRNVSKKSRLPKHASEVKTKHKKKRRSKKSSAHIIQRRSLPTFGEAIKKARLAISSLQNKKPVPTKHVSNYMQHPDLMKMVSLNGIRPANAKLIAANQEKVMQQKDLANSKEQAFNMLKSARINPLKSDAGTLGDELKMQRSNSNIQDKTVNKINGNVHEKIFNQIKQPNISPALQPHLEKPTSGRSNSQLIQRTKIESPQNSKLSKDKMKIVPANVARAVAMAMEQLRRDQMWGKVFVHVLPSGKLKVMVQETKKMPDD